MSHRVSCVAGVGVRGVLAGEPHGPAVSVPRGGRRGRGGGAVRRARAGAHGAAAALLLRRGRRRAHALRPPRQRPTRLSRGTRVALHSFQLIRDRRY